MTCVLFGIVKEILISSIKVEDKMTGDLVELSLSGDDSFDVKVGDTEVFQGESSGGRIRAIRIDIRKFLNPLFEKDLITESGYYTLVVPLNDPFPEAFKEKYVETNVS